MWRKYEYFVALSEEPSISAAAEKLAISHQRLSSYLRSLEKECGVLLFNRSPRLNLTDAGKNLLNMVHEIQSLEINFQLSLESLHRNQSGCFRLGIPSGRDHILLPMLLPDFKRICPDVRLEIRDAPSYQLNLLLQKNELDAALLNQYVADDKHCNLHPMLSEWLYFVISENLLKRFFFDQYPKCRETFTRGIHLTDFQQVPVIMNFQNSISTQAIEFQLRQRGLHLNCVMELPQPDIHIMLCAKDYAACFCWSMYLSTVRTMNRLMPENRLYAFPVIDMPLKNQLTLAIRKGRVLPAYSQMLITLLERHCTEFAPGNFKI